jgi:UDP-N-acetylglucosamine diphosphorylase / glucose-1-phosphate thymidylyltransferase / UDP-N-acetylgalactosamine diphosphorylase / glucosamine-1-phosphate N-acetyltransferase / galactosamine-1-phosphate N-acetyltransferase
MSFIHDFIAQFGIVFAPQSDLKPWELIPNIANILEDQIRLLDDNYKVSNGVAVHKTAIIENGVVMKGPVIIGADCFIGANAYLRGGVYLGNNTKIGTSCEIKSSIIFNNSNIAHFNFIGDSIIGNNVNFEAGSITANHFNERADKKIIVVYKSEIFDTNVEKFGALVGDHSKIGANAVLSPGTILNKNSVVKRLELIDQFDKL